MKAVRLVTVGAGVVALAALGFASIADGASDPLPPSPPVQLPDGRIRVEVLNGGGVRGMARDATLRLREIGFDVVAFGNAPAFDPARPSTVTDRVGRPDAAQAVADALGIDNVHSDPDPTLYVDVSVLLGSEWSRPAGRGGGASGTESRAWWDPRRFLNR